MRFLASSQLKVSCKALLIALYVGSPIIAYYFSLFVGGSLNISLVVSVPLLLMGSFAIVRTGLGGSSALLISLSLFLFWVLISTLMISDSVDYKFQKILALGFNAFAFFSIGKVIDRPVLNQVYLFCSLMAVASAILFIMYFDQIAYGLISARGSDEVNASIYAATGLLCAVSALMILNSSIGAAKYFVSFALLVMCGITGARGPFVLGVIFFVILVFINFKARFYIVAPLLLFVLALSVLGFSLFDVVSEYFPRLSSRFARVFDGESTGRLKHYDFFVGSLHNTWIIWGKGFGSYGLHFWGEDVRAYPHNLIVEVVFELGLVGFFFFAFFIFSAFYNFFYRASSDRAFLLCLIACLVGMLMISSSYADNRLFWFVLSCCAFYRQKYASHS